MRQINRIAVLGAGTMGSRIAAHFANASVDVLLLDLLSPVGDRNSLADKGLERAARERPPAFFTAATRKRVTTGNFDDDLGAVGACDWILEAVSEDLEIKRELWRRIEPLRHPAAILSTNTSGIRLASIAEGFPLAFRRQFLGTHFFNPPRYLHLLELVPGVNTEAAVLREVAALGEEVLGKGIVQAKDTPNFIGNRVGAFYSAAIQRAALEHGLGVAEVDALTGPVIGFPKSASFRLMDLIGLDVWAAVGRNVYDGAPEDPWRDWFLPPSYLERMLENGSLGDKADGGFYRRAGSDKRLEVLDLSTMCYEPLPEVRLGVVDAAKRIAGLPERLRALLNAGTRESRFLSQVFRNVFEYTEAIAPEIADDPDDIDRAMRWGFGHRLGPLALRDAVGDLVGASSVRRLAAVRTNPKVLSLAAQPKITGNDEATIRDLGDRVLCLEFHSKMNAIGEGTLDMFDRAHEVLERFDALVLANEGENFSVGANLAFLHRAAEAGEFDHIEEFIRHFQRCMLQIKYPRKPVVTAMFRRALGGGCEVVLQSWRVQALAESNLGLVEPAVGLVPAAGGLKESVLRFADPSVAFDQIFKGTVSGSAAEAKEMKLLAEDCPVTMNPEFLLHDAKKAALTATDSFHPQTAYAETPVAGREGYQRIWEAFAQRHETTEHDRVVAMKLAFVLTGGDVPAGSLVSEETLLDLEWEAFLVLLGTKATQDRIAYMLKNGKPLRN